MRRLPLIAATALAALVLVPTASAIHPKTIDFIAGFEGYYAEPYNDTAGHCTIGYGHLIHYGGCTRKDYKKWGSLSEAEARQLLRKDLRSYEGAVRERIGSTRVTRPMMTALTSFTFNLGPGMLDRYRSPYLKRTTNVAGKLRNLNYLGAARDMRIYDGVVSGGKRVVLAGLTRRRNEEFKLMKQGIRQLERCGTKCVSKPDPGDSGGVGSK